jgi:curved DNA-binding protein CbpA
MDNPYTTLGVPKNADGGSVKRAYRRKVKKHHPDKKGGSKEAFLAVQLAYDILSDPEKREYYNETGGVKKDNGNRVMELLSKILVTVASELNPKRHDLISAMRQTLNKQLQANTVSQDTLGLRVEQFKEAAKRIGSKTEDNFLRTILETHADQLEKTMAFGDQEIELVKEALKILETFSYRVDKQKEWESRNIDLLSSFFHSQ